MSELFARKGGAHPFAPTRAMDRYMDVQPRKAREAPGPDLRLSAVPEKRPSGPTAANPPSAPRPAQPQPAEPRPAESVDAAAPPRPAPRKRFTFRIDEERRAAFAAAAEREGISGNALLTRLLTHYLREHGWNGPSDETGAWEHDTRWATGKARG